MLWAQGEPVEAAFAVDEDVQAIITAILVLWDLPQKGIDPVTCNSGLQPLCILPVNKFLSMQPLIYINQLYAYTHTSTCIDVLILECMQNKKLRRIRKMK